MNKAEEISKERSRKKKIEREKEKESKKLTEGE